MYDVIVVGGGASGMMAAGRAAERGKRVLLLEKNHTLGEKLKITGGGRCNILNAEENEHTLLANYGKAAKYLHSPFSEFGMKQAWEFFESRGLPLMIEAGNRAFPKSEKAIDVFKVLEKYIKEGKVEVMTDANVSAIHGANGAVEKVIANMKEFTAKSFVIATGGKSHPETGSTGDGFGWLAKLGLDVKEATPTVVPLAVKEKWIKDLAGVTFDGAKITFFVDGTKKLMLKGRILCTHFGVSGPLILNAAGKVADMLHEGVVTAKIDAFPGEDHGTLDKRIMKVFEENKNKSLKNIFPHIAPKGTAESILKLTGIDEEKKVHSVSREERKEIVNLLKELPLTIQGLMGYDRAVVVDGGLSLAEVEAKTMRVKKYQNLFVTGDLLDISRPSGGYSLQLCWTTGFLAGDTVE